MRRPLPVQDADRSLTERADAARNRRKILAAAEALFAQRGVSAVSMDDIARAARVGKGTLYRRFTDRASLALALLDEHEQGLQEAFIRGEPPLGPGAPPRERLHAFGEAYLELLDRHAELITEAEGRPLVRYRLAPYAAYRAHLTVLLAEADPGGDAALGAEVLLAALSGSLFVHLRTERGFGLERLQAGWRRLVDGWLAASAGEERAG
jgi:AcrR family transcriptional regulator